MHMGTLGSGEDCWTEPPTPSLPGVHPESPPWRDHLLARNHALPPDLNRERIQYGGIEPLRWMIRIAQYPL